MQDGSVLKDMHGEILALRGLKRYLYRHLILWMDSRTRSRSILALPTPHDSGASFNGRRLQLRPGFTFHLYINTAPCGDARVYSVGASDEAMSAAAPPGFARRNVGALRSKIEMGEGTVLIPPDQQHQSIDGILGGRRLRIMACSDKLLRRKELSI